MHSSCAHILHTVHCIHFSFGLLSEYADIHTTQRHSSSNNDSCRVLVFFLFVAFRLFFSPSNLFLICLALVRSILISCSLLISSFSDILIFQYIVDFLVFRPLFVDFLGGAFGSGRIASGENKDGLVEVVTFSV